MKKLVVLIAVLFALVTLAYGKSLPRGLEEIGIDVPVRLGMRSKDLDKIKGHVVKSGRFVAITMGNDYQLSIKLDPNETRVCEIVIQLKKDQFGAVVRKARELYREGNQYESEKLDGRATHVWKDKKTRLGLFRNKGGYRLELSALTE